MPKPYATYPKGFFKMSTSYEWNVRELDEYGDSVECLFFDTYKEAAASAKDFPLHSISLVRSRGSDAEGMDDRQEADVEGGKFTDDEMDGGAKIPKRFLAEVAKG